MKKIFFLIISLLFIQINLAQSDEPYILRFHYMSVSGDVNEFIEANKTYFKKLAEQGVKDEAWAGWEMHQSISEGNKFLFIHHFKSPKQYENYGNVFSGDVAKKLGLKSPNWGSFQTEGEPYEFWQIVSSALGKTSSKYFVKNEFKFTDTKKFVENNKLWGEMVINPQLENNEGMNWACGIKMIGNYWEDGNMMSFNGISFDGFNSLESLMKGSAYSETATPNNYYEKFVEELQKRELNDFASARKSSVWKVIDNTWD